MENICLDTDILVDVLRNKQEAIAFIESNEITNNLATTYVNIFELYYGAMMSSSKEHNLIAVEKLSSRLRILNLSKASVHEAGRTMAELTKEGNSVDFRDVFIGTIALTEGFGIKTRNIKHFNKIKNLRIIE